MAATYNEALTPNNSKCNACSAERSCYRVSKPKLFDAGASRIKTTICIKLLVMLSSSFIIDWLF